MTPDVEAPRIRYSKVANTAKDIKSSLNISYDLDKREKAFRIEGLKNVDVYDIAILYGFKEHELALASPNFGLIQACFYSKFPIVIRGRLEDLKGVLPFKARRIDGNFVELNLRLKDIDKVSHSNKKKVFNSLKRIDELGTVEWLKQFVEVVKLYPNTNTMNESGEKKYTNYKEVWRDGDYTVVMMADPALTPQIVPLRGRLIKLRYKGVILQCQNYFCLGHTKIGFNNSKIKTQDYANTIKQTITNNVSREENEGFIARR
nr:uncharacterized protein LOC121115010 [Lepeophtheirus salmonis]